MEKVYDNIWQGAKWIGNPRGTENTYGVYDYKISGEFKAEGSLSLIVNARNKDNYILFDMEEDSVRMYETCDNAWNEGRPYTKLLGEWDAKIAVGERHVFCLEVNRCRVCLTVEENVIIDGADIIPHDVPNCPLKACLMNIGFKQTKRVELYSLKIENTKTGCVYHDGKFCEADVLSSLGTVRDGTLLLDGFELAYPAGAVNVRRKFSADRDIKRARLYASARGFYNAYINGEKVGADFYNPGFTDYRLRIQYQTFDVTDMIRRGENVISAVVAKGHYSGFCGYSGCMVYGEERAFIAALVIEYADGGGETVVTDCSWEFTSRGPISDSDYFDGETYDAREEFDRSEDSARWIKCGVKEYDGTVVPTNGSLEGVKFTLSPQIGNTARVVKVLKGVYVGELPVRHYVYDMGQNMVGTIRVKLRGRRGETVKIRYGEMMYKGGGLYIKNLRSAASTDVYTLKGSEDGETYVPSFTSHGFRYVEISACGGVHGAHILSLEGLVISNVSVVTGGFECSNPFVNKLVENIIWGQRGNSLLVPTDCPQRNERMGWTGDVQVFARTGAYLMDMRGFINKWLRDLRDGQLMYNKDGAVPDTAPLGGDNRRDGCGGWGDAAVIVPWEMYMAYGDIRVLEDNYDMMKKWVEYQSRPERQNYGLRIVDGADAPDRSDMASIPFIQVQQRRGDHLTFDNSTPYIYAATAYAAHSADLLSRIARLLGKYEDATKYNERFLNIKRAFNEAWVKDDGSIAYWGEMSATAPHVGESVSIDKSVTRYTYYSDAPDSTHHPSQTAYALAIDFGLIPKEKLCHASRCFKNTIDRNGKKLTVGFLGISHLMNALTKAGLDETAFALLLGEDNPGWLYSVKNGATTIWERWDSYIAETGEFGPVEMNSFNHYAYGAVGEWLFSRILGIRPREAGYKSFYLEPTRGGSLTYAKGFHDCPYGKIESAWSEKDGRTVYSFTVPDGTAAYLLLPEKAENDPSGAVYSGERVGKHVYKLCGGKYKFETLI